MCRPDSLASEAMGTTVPPSRERSRTPPSPWTPDEEPSAPSAANVADPDEAAEAVAVPSPPVTAPPSRDRPERRRAPQGKDKGRGNKGSKGPGRRS